MQKNTVQTCVTRNEEGNEKKMESCNGEDSKSFTQLH